MSQAALTLYLADGVVVLFAAMGTLSSFFEARRQIVRRSRLLAPGVCAFIAAMISITYPNPREFFQAQLLMVALLSLLAGVARGITLYLFADQKWDLVRLRRTWDGAVLACLVMVVGAFDLAVEIRAGAETHLAPIVELIMIVLSAYLLGRSVTAWLRAGLLPHEDLHEKIL